MANPTTYVASDTKASWANAGIMAELATGATSPIQILRIAIGQNTSTASAMVTAFIARETGTATFTSAQTPTPAKLYNRDSAANTTVKGFGTAAVTNGAGYAEVHHESWNVLNGWLYLPVPQELAIIPASAWVAIGLLGTVPSATYFYEIIFQELG